MPDRPPPSSPAVPGAAPRFRLLRYYALTTLVAFIAVAAVLVALQRSEEVFFDQVQRQQRAFFSQAQATLAKQHAEAARASLLAVHEASHVNLTRLVANMLWDSDIAPYVEQAKVVPAGPCPGADADQRRACSRERGRALRALPGFRGLDRNAYAAMRATSVFKIKVFDLRGLTLYSSEHAQVGEDASPNAGWRSAAEGRPASELTHRDRFSAFERVVEDSDLISTYVPVRRGPGDGLVGVVELYSDVTPFLAQIREAGDRFAAITSANEAAVVARADENRREVSESSDRFLFIVLGLLAALFAAGLLVVRRGQQLIDRQAAAQVLATQREQQWHREKMAALATMAANVSHEVGNPLTVIAGIAQELPPPAADAPSPAGRILEQTVRIGTMMRQISDFAAARGAEPDWVDVNALVKSVCDFHAFDRRFRSTVVSFVPGAQLPACRLAPDLLNEVVMGLLQSISEAAAMGSDAAHGELRVRTRREGAHLVVELAHEAAGPGLDACPRLPPARRRMTELGGELRLEPGRVKLLLPVGAD